MSDCIILDTETTGIVDPVIVEAAWLKISNISTLKVDEEFCQRYNPGKPIGYGAMATHHITNEDVSDCPPASDFRLPEGTEYIIGHNVDFDWNAIGKPDVKRICTLAIARKLWPAIDSHSQSALIYFLLGAELLGTEAAKSLTQNAHSALHDVHMCRRILDYALDAVGGFDSWQALWEFSEHARIPEIISFGKHKGMKIKELPNDYKRWIINQSEMDPYLIKAVRISMGLATN